MAFRNDFLWGAASAAYQVEGAFKDDSKGPGIWDVLAHEQDRTAHGETGDVACDHYHRFREDVAIMKELGLKSYRFSVSWPRVLPEGTGRVNEKGIRFYSELVDALLEAGIEPMLTLYHWNLPYALHEKGGWRNPDSSDWFAEYAGLLASRLGDRVRYWMTFNEPQIFVGLGHVVGIHAPFEKDCPDEELIAISRNVLLAHGKAVRVLRSVVGEKANIGLAPTGDCYLPTENTAEAVEEARKKSFLLDDNFVMSNVWWADPIFLGRVPEGAEARFGEKMYRFSEEEWALVHQPLDFYGFNVYQGALSRGPQAHYDSGEHYDEYGYAGCPMTSFNWHVTPDVLYYCAKFLYERYGRPVLVTENGMANFDWVALDGKVHDPLRIDYLHRYLLELRRAADEGIPVVGYTYWSILDNYEWSAGYDQRFGLVHVDYRTQKRTIKDAGYFYRDVIRSNGANL